MRSIAAALLLLSIPLEASAQLFSASEGPVAYGHHHVNATDVDAHKRFWIDGLGGTRITLGSSSAQVVSFPDVLVFLAGREASGGTKGSIVNHVGFEVQDLRSAVDRVEAMGFPIVTADELPSSYTVTDGLGQRPGGNLIAFVMGPDETKVELMENRSIDHPIRMHHVHFATPDGEAMRAWYAEHFGATAGSRIGQPAADLPGVNLTFGPTATDVVGTRGRALDHIGFEVRDLRGLVQRLEAAGLSMDRGYTEVASMGIAIAFFTDPWGTYVELTEGLAPGEGGGR